MTILLPAWYTNWVLLEGERLRQIRLHGLEALTRTPSRQACSRSLRSHSGESAQYGVNLGRTYRLRALVAPVPLTEAVVGASNTADKSTAPLREFIKVEWGPRSRDRRGIRSR